MSGILRANSPVSLMDPLLQSMEYLSVNFLDMFLIHTSVFAKFLAFLTIYHTDCETKK